MSLNYLISVKLWRVFFGLLVTLNALPLTRAQNSPPATLPQLGQPVGPPNTSGDPAPPYPDLTTSAAFGTRLFGWYGCGTSDIEVIKQAYDDTHNMAVLDGNYKNINWRSFAAREFWGPSTGINAPSDAVKAQIQNIMFNVQETYTFSAAWPFAFYIYVRCSSTIGDPDNKCGDRAEGPPSCPGGQPPTPPDGSTKLQAYSDPSGTNGYSQITFCNEFFNILIDLEQQIRITRRSSVAAVRNNLQAYDNRARCLFHEITHLDYFMEAPGTNPYTDDLQVTYKKGGFRVTESAYGAFNSKVVANYRARGRGGFYPQRNADNFAFFALANYVQSKTSSYPSFPRANIAPLSPPKDRNGDSLVEYTLGSDGIIDFDTTGLSTYEADKSYSIPGCPDKQDVEDSSSSPNVTIDGWTTAADEEPEYLAQEQAWLANFYTFNLANTILRVLPLGDSITNGFQSSDGNGYRLKLFNDLSGNGNEVNFIGSVRAGTMADNENEGHDSATIAQIASFATASLPERPNVVLLHAGTNDMNIPQDPSTAPDRLGSLMDQILTTCPDALLLVAQIIPSGSGATQANIVQYNAAIPSLVAARQASGHHVMVVDMFTQLLSPDNYADDLHPNDGGYAIMGDVWYRAIAYAGAELGWVNPPVASTGGSGGLITCNVLPDWIPQGVIANGAGLGKNAYPSIVCQDNPEDLAQCSCGNADGSGIAEVQFKTGGSCGAMGYDLVHAVHFADLNGDGRAEYLWVDENGGVTAFLNLGPPSGEESAQGGTPGWLPQGVIASGVGARRQEVQFADLNGDGRAEYLWVHPNGSVEAWLNLGGPDNGPNAAKVGWLPQGLIADGIGAPGSSVMFADLNGDGRAEYLSIDENGAVTCYLNLGPSIDNGPHAAIVGWLPQGVIATGVGGLRNNTVFADINGDGRADYLEVARTSSGAVNEWKNGGGPDNGPHAAQVVWYPQGSITGGDGSSGANVMFADLNGDGRAEYLEVDPNTSAVTAYLNGCPK